MLERTPPLEDVSGQSALDYVHEDATLLLLQARMFPERSSRRLERSNSGGLPFRRAANLEQRTASAELTPDLNTNGEARMQKRERPPSSIRRSQVLRASQRLGIAVFSSN